MSAFADNLTILFFLVVLVFAGILLLVIVDAVDDAFSTADVSQTGKDVTSSFDTEIPYIIDWLVPLLFIGLPLIALALAFTNYVPPVFYWVAGLAAFVLSIVGFVVQDLYADFVGPTLISDAASSVPITNFLFSNMGYYVIIVWLLLALGTYAKTQNLGVGF